MTRFNELIVCSEHLHDTNVSLYLQQLGITQNIVLVALSSNVNSTVTIEWHTISLLALHPQGVW